MNSELEVLKKIWENDRKAYIRLISNQTKLGIDYTCYLCNCLFKKGQIKLVKGKRDCYRITSRGKRELRSRQLISPKTSKKITKVEKVIYYLPKKLKVKPSESNFRKVKTKGPKTKGPKGNLIEPEEKKLNLWRNIKKAVSFLKQFLF